MGLNAFQEMKSKKPIVAKGPQVKQVQWVGKRIAKVVKMSHAQWEFVLFKDPEPNAFALPVGKVGFHTGILPITRNEAGLAIVMAHVIAHHGSERVSQGMLIGSGNF